MKQWNNTMSRSISIGNRGRLPLDDTVGLDDLVVIRLLVCEALLERGTWGKVLLFEGI